MRKLITKIKVKQPAPIVEFVLTKKEALFVRDLIGGMNDGQIREAVEGSLNLSYLRGDKIIEAKDALQDELNENL